MSLEALKNEIQDYAKDIRLNLSSVLSTDGAPGLKENQIWGTALSCAYSTKNKELIQAIETDAAAHLSDAEKHAAKAAATIMAMNNVYYSFNHMVKDPEITKLPARLRMNIIGNPGIDKIDFEFYCIAVSAMNGCEMCVNSHIAQVKKAGMTNEAVQSAARIAAVINAAATALEIR